MRADYLERFRPYFVRDGFNRLSTRGAVFAECRYGHAGTKTAPGHATMLSGSHPSTHGIMANDWADPESWRRMNAVEDPNAPLVGAAPHAWRSPGGVLEAKEGRSPRNFRAMTVGDQLKLRHGDGSKVFAAAIKDRSAILMGGKLADAAYWVRNGRVITSTYYHEELPAWVEKFNERRLVEASLGKAWDRLLAPEIYDGVQGPDDAPGERGEWSIGKTFPRKVDGNAGEIGKEFYDAWYVSPFSNEFLVEFAKTAVKEEQLGRHEKSDMLCLSFAQIDGIGHYAGPDSHEIMDSMLRLDRALADLFKFLDREIGLERCVIALTADHGCAPLPERVQSFGRPGLPATRVDASKMDAVVLEALTTTFGAPAENEQWLMRDNEGYRLSRESLAARDVSLDDAARVVRDALAGLDEVEVAFTRHEILGSTPTAKTRLLTMARNSYPPALGQDVVFIYKPYVIRAGVAGATHGSPWDYDTHVPMVFMGGRAPVGKHLEPVGVIDLASTLAPMLGVPPPPQAQGRRLF